MNHIVFFDLETSGLDPQVHEIIQIAAVACKLPDLEIVDEFEVKVRFDTSKMESAGHNRFDSWDWKEAVSPKNAKNKFGNFLGRHSTKKLIGLFGKSRFVSYLGGHNINEFDIKFLNNLWGEGIKPYYSIGWDTLWKAEEVELFGFINTIDLKLSTLAQHFNLKTQTHDALDDVRLNVEVAKKLLEF